MRYFLFIFLFVAVIWACAGCAGIEPPNPKDILSEPFGSGGLRVGMSRDEVISLWGQPDTVNANVVLKDSGKIREEWVYRARVSDIPINKNYFSKTRRLYFDGNNLTSIK
jgi:hypothetical protein